MAQNTHSHIGFRFPWPARPLSSAPARSPVAATSKLLSHFTISCAYCSARGHGGVAERDRDGVVPAQVLLGHLRVVVCKTRRETWIGRQNSSLANTFLLRTTVYAADMARGCRLLRDAIAPRRYRCITCERRALANKLSFFAAY